MRTSVTIIIFTLFVTGALAENAPQPDAIGVYFDQSGTITCYTPTPTVPFPTYAVLTDPSATEIHAFEFRYRIADPSLIILSTEVTGADPVIPEPVYDPVEDQFVIEPSTPIPVLPSTVLVSWTMMRLGMGPGEIYLGPTEMVGGGNGVMAYLSESGTVPLTPISGDPSIPVTLFECPDPIQGSTFGTLKALYR